jgi:error-prone DNA polymerase
MGFYSTSRLIIDARDHGVEVRDIDINHSDWDSILEPAAGRYGHALRLGLREIKGLRQEDADRLVKARDGGYAAIRDIWRRAQLPPAVLERLAHADAFGSLGLSRRDALWTIKGLSDAPLPLFDFAEAATPQGHNLPPADTGIEEDVTLPRMTMGENVIRDYRHKGHSSRPHPMLLLRPRMKAMNIVTSRDLLDIADGKKVRIAGIVQVRQRPGTASGVIFATIQDETGDAQAIIWPVVFDKFRTESLASKLMVIEGKLQKEGDIIHVVANRIINANEILGELGDIDLDTDFNVLSRADEMKNPPRQVKEVLVALPDSRDFR